jgi:hypothetical protein
MLARLRPYLTFANVVSLLALFIALGGGAYAMTLPRNSVGASQLKKNAVTSAKLKNGAVTSAKLKNGAVISSKIGTGAITGSKIKARSLLAKNFAVGQLPTGPRGAQGESGPAGVQGAAGSAVAYGSFAGSSTGVSISGPVKKLSAGNISRAGAGAYCFSGLSFTPNNLVATLDSSYTSGFVTASTTPFGPCPVGTQAEVKTFDAAGTAADRSFSVLFN